MAIDPNKMAAFASAGPKPGTEDSTGGDTAEVEPGDTAEGGDDTQEGGAGRFGELIPLLEANAEELAACCDELDPEALSDTSTALEGDNLEILTESVMALPGDLLAEMMATLSGVTWEEAEELVAHLEDEGMIDDAALVAALLTHIGKLIDSGDLSTESAEDEDEGAESEDADEGEESEDEGEEYAEGE